MGLPFVIAEAVSFITGTNGKIAEVTADNRLQVESKLSPKISDRIASYGSLLNYDDINISNGLARNTQVLDSAQSLAYSYNGSGLLIGFLLTLEKLDDGWEVDLVVDGNHIFGITGINTKDMDKSSIYNYDVSDVTKNNKLGFDLQKDTVNWEGPQGVPIKFNTSILINIKRVTGQGNKKFKAGLVTIYKET